MNDKRTDIGDARFTFPEALGVSETLAELIENSVHQGSLLGKIGEGYNLLCDFSVGGKKFGNGYGLGKSGNYYSGKYYGGSKNVVGLQSSAKSVSKVFAAAGRRLFVLGALNSAYQVYNYQQTIGKAAIDTAMGVIGVWSGLIGLGISASYFIIDSTVGWDWTGLTNNNEAIKP